MNRYRNQYIIVGILFLAFFAAAVNGAFQGALHQPFETIGATTNETIFARGTFVGPALSLVRTGTFNYGGSAEHDGFVGLVQRGPAYASVLALFFLLFGENVFPVLLVNGLSLASAIIFLWLISKRFLPGFWQFLPSLMLALFWEVSALVWVGNYEMFTLALATLFFFSFLRFKDTKNVWWLTTAAFALAFWVLERPPMFYFIPFPFFYLVFWHWSSSPRRQLFAHLFLFAAIIGTVVGVWLIRNHQVLDTWQLGSPGHAILRRSSHVDFSFPELISMALSFSVGDLIGSKLYAHYPPDRTPKTWDSRVEARWYQPGWIVTDLDGETITKIELDKKMVKEAYANVARQPIKFFLTGFINFFRLNAPMNYNGMEMMHFLAEGRDNIPEAVKIAINLGIRIPWHLFVIVTFFSAVTYLGAWAGLSVLALFVFYHNAMFIFLSHAEVRYLLAAMPFYFLFFVEGLRILYQRFFANTNTLTPNG